MGSKRYVAFPAVLAMLVVMAGPAPAQATVFAKDHFTFEDSFDEDLCGIAVRHDFAVSGHFRTRTGKGELDQAFFGQSSIEFTDTFTNLATGASFSIEGRLTGMDVKATPLGGNVFEFKFRESGTVVVRDMDGDVVLRQAGAVWLTVVFDTLGDTRLDGGYGNPGRTGDEDATARPDRGRRRDERNRANETRTAP